MKMTDKQCAALGRLSKIAGISKEALLSPKTLNGLKFFMRGLLNKGIRRDPNKLSYIVGGNTPRREAINSSALRAYLKGQFARQDTLDDLEFFGKGLATATTGASAGVTGFALGSEHGKKYADSAAGYYDPDPKAVELTNAMAARRNAKEKALAADGREAQEWYDKNQLADDMKQAEEVSKWDKLLEKAKQFGSDYGASVGTGAGIGGLGGYGIGQLANLSTSGKILAALLGAGLGGTAGWAAQEYGPDLYKKIKG